ncbi:MAG: SGNH/GDSL hydrolase family protein [Acidobacteriia bacterium]|nr:SGNH/GDSL hydrolase family protein [Terriglobia bacterium]
MKTFQLLFLAALALSAGELHWVATWETSPGGPATNLRSFKDQTIREIVHVSLGGIPVRVRISNVYGTKPIVVGSAHVALRRSGSSFVAESDRTLKFGGQPTVMIPPGALVVSDPASLNVPANSDLAISIFLPAETPAETVHRAAFQTSYLAQGDLTSTPEFPAGAETMTSWPFLAGIDVARSSPAEAIVAFGDSITDGSGSTRDANHRWTDYLLARLTSTKTHHAIAVLNAGIGGNRVTYNGSGPLAYAGPSLRTRFDHDVLAQPGVRYVIVLAGINDIGVPGTSFAPLSEEVSPAEIVASLRQVAERAHEHGLRIFAGTLTPFEGSTIKGYFTDERETRRQEVNKLIRSGQGFDGIIDFDKAIADPSHPSRILPRYDSGDHLHLNDVGYQAMAEVIDLSFFDSKRRY